MADSGCLGLITGQIIGRCGNFFNCEAFGGYTDSLFCHENQKSAGQRKHDIPGSVKPSDCEGRCRIYTGTSDLLYESVWNLGVLAFMLWYRKRKKFNGEMLLIYLLGYGLGRVWIEGLRTDQLIFFNTGIAVSQALSLVLVVISALMLIWKHRQIRLKSKGED